MLDPNGVIPFKNLGTPYVGVTTGSANAYVASGPAIDVNQVILLQIHAANTDASTLNYNGMGVEPLLLNGAALEGGELPDNALVYALWDGSDWRLVFKLGGSAPLPELGTLILDLDSSDIARFPGLSGGRITTWEDLTAFNKDHYQEVLSLQPHYNVHTQNGLALVTFYHTNFQFVDNTDIGPSPSEVQTAFTVYAAGQVDSSDGAIWSIVTPGAKNRAWIGASGGKLAAGGVNVNAETELQLVSATDVTGESFGINCAVFDIANTTLSLYRNNTLVASRSDYHSSIETDNATLHSIVSWAYGAGYLSQKLGRLRVYLGRHDAIARAAVMAELNPQWGL